MTQFEYYCTRTGAKTKSNIWNLWKPVRYEFDNDTSRLISDMGMQGYRMVQWSEMTGVIIFIRRVVPPRPMSEREMAGMSMAQNVRSADNYLGKLNSDVHL